MTAMALRSATRAVLSAGVVAALAVSLPASASAQPPGFPDLNNLVDATSTHQLTEAHDPLVTVGFVFTTPDGIACSGDPTMVSCGGVFPGMTNVPVDPKYTAGDCEVDYASGESDLARLEHGREACRAPATDPVLAPGQKVTFGPSICGVLPGEVTACTNGIHGFVLQPTGSWSF